MGVNDRQKDKQESKKASERQQTFRFINYDLSKADLEGLESLDCAEEFPAEMVEDLVAEGYKYSLTYDKRNHTYIASLTDKSEGSLFANACISGRGSDAPNARYALLYRHSVVARGDWSVLDIPQNINPPTFG